MPRQANLVPELVATVAILPEYSRAEAFAQLESFSHIWLLSVFHQAIRDGWQPTVRPPRLGGNTRVGVFASRAPYRPNPIGMSMVQLLKIEQYTDHLRLQIAGCDLVDGTPIVDIKPYLPYADAQPHASAGYTAATALPHLLVEFSTVAILNLQTYAPSRQVELQGLITSLIQQDPRPAYAEDRINRKYAFRLENMDVVFTVVDERAVVEELKPV